MALHLLKCRLFEVYLPLFVVDMSAELSKRFFIFELCTTEFQFDDRKSTKFIINFPHYVNRGQISTQPLRMWKQKIKEKRKANILNATR